MNNNVFKRIIAYIIDFLVITIISAGCTKLSFINPNQKKYEQVSVSYSKLLEDYYNNEISINEFTEKTSSLSYDMNKNGVVFLGCDIVIILLYFSGFALITKGQTLGKKIMNIKVISNDGSDAKIHQYLIRSIILNGVLINITVIIATFFSHKTYNIIYNITSSINMIIELVIIFMILFTSNHRGLHDLLAGTKVIAANEPEDKNKLLETTEET